VSLPEVPYLFFFSFFSDFSARDDFFLSSSLSSPLHPGGRGVRKRVDEEVGGDVDDAFPSLFFFFWSFSLSFPFLGDEARGCGSFERSASLFSLFPLSGSFPNGSRSGT